MTDMERDVFHKEYMPYIIKWGKLTCWLSIPLIFVPAIALYIFYQAVPSVGGVITGFIALFSSMVAWYVVDPITLYPILHIPGMYMTYIAGNSKEIRAPAATAALSATDVEAGTEHGTIISAIAIYPQPAARVHYRGTQLPAARPVRCDVHAAYHDGL